MLATALTSGCAHEAEQASAAAATSGVEASANELRDPRTRQAISELLRSPELQAATRDLAANVTEGAVNGLTQEQQAERIQEFSRQYVLTLSSALAEALGRDLPRESAAVAAAFTDAALRSAMSSQHRAEMEALSGAIGRAASQAIAQGIREDVGPALREVLAHDVGPGLGGMLNDSTLDAALDRTARSLSRQVSIGVQDAVPSGGPSVLFMIFLVAAGFCIVAAIALLIWSLRLRSRLREEHLEMERREAGIVLLAKAIKNTEDKPWSPELQETLRETVRDEDASEYVRETLRKHKELRLGHADHSIGH